jgi:hypothetical protein
MHGVATRRKSDIGLAQFPWVETHGYRQMSLRDSKTEKNQNAVA